MDGQQPQAPPAAPKARLDPETVLRSLIPELAWAETMVAMATSVELAHWANPSAWGFSLKPRGIMLNVGPHEVLQINRGDPPIFQLIVDAHGVPDEARQHPDVWFSGDQDYRGTPGSIGFYVSGPGSEKFFLSFDVVASAYSLLLPAHTAIIEQAARRRRNPMTAKAHSASLVRFIGQEAGRALPQPSYPRS
jgi:hypothetical protein